MSSYLVIARKWRPALFDEIIGQGHVTRTLKNALSGGRIAHAYLFSGPRGVGKTTAARILARGLNCEKGPTPEPCNRCAFCTGITNGSSVDVFEIDGASNTGVENVRELRENVVYMPAAARFKVYIIDEVHMLSMQAFNALLKTLEEPPPHVVFIFATTEVHKIPATILSRCQRFDFRRIPFRDIQAHLKKILTEEGIEFEKDALTVLAREADGSLRDAQSLLDQVLAFGDGVVRNADVSDALGLMDSNVMIGLVKALAASDGRECLNIVEKIHNFGYDLKRASAELLARIRDLTIIKTTGAGELLEIPDNELKELQTVAGGLSLERLHMLFNLISRGYEDVTRSAYPRYSFEMALLRAAHFDDVRPVGELVDRIEALGRRLQRAPAAAPQKAHSPRPVSPAGNEKGRAEQTPSLKGSSPAAPERPRESGAVPEAGKEGASDGLIEYIKQMDRAVFDPLQEASITVKGDHVEVLVDSEKFNFLKNVKQARLKEILEGYFKRPVQVEITPRNAKKAAGRDPAGEVVRIFDGRVIEDTYRGTDV